MEVQKILESIFEFDVVPDSFDRIAFGKVPTVEQKFVPDRDVTEEYSQDYVVQTMDREIPIPNIPPIIERDTIESQQKWQEGLQEEIEARGFEVRWFWRKSSF